MVKKIHSEPFKILYMLLIMLVCMLTFSIIQPFGDGPDEINRFKIVEYIYEHGSLPVGDAPEVLIDGYGASYAFQPMLTYIIDGYLLRAISVLEPSLEMRIFLSRLVNVFMGLVTALYVKKLSDLLFFNKKTAWAFTLAVVFLPQNLFIHTYVNTDSMGLLSIALVLHALVLGLKENFSKKTCIELSIGIILCALSYYNCYGIVVCAVLFFLLYFIQIVPKENNPITAKVSPFTGSFVPTSATDTALADNTASGESTVFHKISVAADDISTNAVSKYKLAYDYRSLFKKGLFISAIVLLGISWWFVRNGILYNGDILALNARNLCAAETGLESYNPFTRDTYQRLGIPLKEMIFETDYFTLVWKSFIAMFGPMLIPTHHYIYMAFRDLFFLCVTGLLITIKTAVLTWANRYHRFLVNMIMLLAIVIPVILALYYSYTFDFQPQGRYYLPMVIPFMYFLAIGFEKIVTIIGIPLGKINQKVQNLTCAALYHILYAFLTLSLLYATFVSMLGYYKMNGGSLW